MLSGSLNNIKPNNDTEQIIIMFNFCVYQPLIYSKTAIQAVKKSAAQSGSPTQNGQGKKM